MSSPRVIAIGVAGLFIVATAASVAAMVLLDPLLLAGDYLAEIAARRGVLVSAVLLMFVAAAAIISIPVMLFPIPRRQSEAGALLYFAARIFESVTYLLGGIFTLSLLSLADEGATPGGRSEPVSTLAAVLRDLADLSFAVGPAVFFSLSAMILAVLFYQTQLVPRWLAVWKFLGAALLLIQGVLILFDAITPILEGTLFLPIAVNEMVLAVWLILRGFSAPALVRLGM